VNPTPYRDLNEVLSEFVGGVRSILGDDLVAACLQGSFAVGDFDEHSDCDWVMAIARPLTEDQVAALQAVFHRVYKTRSRPCRRSSTACTSFRAPGRSTSRARTSRSTSCGPAIALQAQWQ